jgi:ATP-dependent DNA helicase RecG
MTKLLQNLVGKGVLVQDGQGRWTRYHLSSGSNSRHNEVHSVHKSIDSVHNEIHSIHKNVDSVHKTEFTGNEWDALVQMAEPIRNNKRLAPHEFEATLLKLCQRPCHYPQIPRKKFIQNDKQIVYYIQ